MPKQTIHQNNFNAGEISPRAAGRFDYEKYPNAVKKLEGFLINQLGGASFFPGTRYVATVKDSNARTRLISFQFSSTQAYLLEMGDMYMRFYTKGGQVIITDTVPIDSFTKFLAHFDGYNGQQSYVAETGQNISFFGNAKLDTSIYLNTKFVSSVFFDGGNASRLTVPDSDNWNFGTGDFSIDFLAQFLTLGDIYFMTQNEAGKNITITYDNVNHKLSMWYFDGSTTKSFSRAFNPSINQFYHIEFDRHGTSAGNFYIFINGVSTGVTADDWALSFPNLSAPLTIGGDNGGVGHLFNGYIDELRITKGTYRHITDFSTPSSPYGGVPIWVTSTTYAVGDYVNNSGTVYRCLIGHTSGTFSTDLAAGDWLATPVYEISTPYAVADIPNVHYSQNADVTYFYHKSYPTQKLTRVSSTQFTLKAAPFVRGPFLTDNFTATTITPSAATGTNISLTATTAIFNALHLGSLWKVHNAVVKITVFDSSTVVHGDVQAEPDGTAGNIGGTSAYTDWAEGAFSDSRGYPATGTFHQQRHYVAAALNNPQDIWGSFIGAYDNFKVDANDISASVHFQIVSDQVNLIKWLNSDTDFMDVGTSGGVFPVSSGNQGVTISSANIKANKDTSYGVFSTLPKRVSSFLYYIHKGTFKLFELVYNYLVNRQVANDMTIIADHILRDGNGAFDLAYQQTPNDRLWVIRNDGQLAIMTRNVEQQVIGWSRRIAGRDSTTNGMFESIAIIQQESQDDEVWVITKRAINGVTKRFVEYFTSEYFNYVYEPIFLDASLTYDKPINISGITKASPPVVTAVGHTFSNGNSVGIRNVVGMTQINGNFVIQNVTANTFELVAVDSTAYSTYISGGQARKMVTVVTGLDHLNGETVSATVDGKIPSTPTYVVSGGSITLSDMAGVIHVGLPYTGKIQFLKMNTQSKTGTGQTKKKRIYRVDFRLFKSQKFKIGQDENNLLAVTIPLALVGGDGTDIYTGDLNNVVFKNWFDENTEAVIQQDLPLPLHLLATFWKVETEEQE